MDTPAADDIPFLNAMHGGDPAAAEKLLPLVYSELLGPVSPPAGRSLKRRAPSKCSAIDPTIHQVLPDPKG
jgi:hypothetical protein